MQQSNFSERYHRQLRLPGFGSDAQGKLSAAKVLVVGAGGLGVPALQYLAGMGIGTIGIVDDDVISLGNLHRQVLYSTAETGQPKVLVAAAKLAALNPGIAIHACQAKLAPDNALGLIQDYDVMVDATDNFAARYLINDACIMLSKPFVYGAVHQYEGHVSVFNFNGGPTYRCLYPVPPSVDEIPDCNTAGVLGVVPGIIGCRQALEVVKIISGIGRTLSGYLQVFDFLNDEQHKIKLKADPRNREIQALQESYVTTSCNVDARALHPQALQAWRAGDRSFLLLDVREPDEFESGHLPEAVNLPLSAISAEMRAIESSDPVVLYCSTGRRSLKAASILHQRRPALKLFDLVGGLDNWLKHGFRL